MNWTPIPLDELQEMIVRDLEECSDDQRSFFARVAITPEKWRQSPYGDAGGGFWAVAIHKDRVLWYNDVEEGFNVSTFKLQGEIPLDQYWCNQDQLRFALSHLSHESMI